MKGRPWTAEDDAQLLARFADTPTPQLARELGRSYGAVAARAGAFGITKSAEGRARGAATRVTGGARRTWTNADDARLRGLYADLRTDQVAARLDRSLASVYNRARKLGLEKSEAYLASPDACRLRRDNHPGVAFQKGQAGHNWRPVGSERLVDGYRYTKVSDHRHVPWTRNWRPTHVLLWEKHHGAVPKSHALVFANGDRTDVRLENLKLLTRRELMQRNSVHNLPAPLPEMIQLIGAINRKINRRTRHAEQDRGPAQPPLRGAGGAVGQGESDGPRSRADDRGGRSRDRRLCEGGGRVHRGDGRARGDGVHPASGGGRAERAAAAGVGLGTVADLTGLARPRNRRKAAGA